MLTGFRRTVRFAREWSRAAQVPGDPEGISSPGAAALEVRDMVLDLPEGGIEATVYRPAGSGVGPGWILLHGMTRTGRRHRNLVRFARSLAATGATVVVPEIPEWVQLELAPGRTRVAIRAGLQALQGEARVRGRPGLVGFSFGGPQALRAAALPEFAGRLGSVASFGGYADIGRTMDFLLTGRFRWRGSERRQEVDPYGRWIVAANYLTRVPGYEGAAPVAHALRELAVHAGDEGIESWDPRLDPVKESVARALPDDLRPLFHYFAPPAAGDPLPEDDETREWSSLLSAAGVAHDPDLALPAELHVPCPVFLVHGRSDALIPVSELPELARRMRAPRRTVAVTGLFAHSADAPGRRYPGEGVVESARLALVLSRILGSV